MAPTVAITLKLPVHTVRALRVHARRRAAVDADPEPRIEIVAESHEPLGSRSRAVEVLDVE